MTTLTKISAFYTLLKETDAGQTAYLIMPSHAKSKTSYSRCRVDLKTGKLKLTNRDITHIQAGTVYEMDNILYRRCAHDNFEVVRKIHTVPSVSNNLTDAISLWLAALPTSTRRAWLHFGGDVFYMNELVCLIDAARRHADTTIYLQSGRTQLLNVMQGKIDAQEIAMPSNFILGAETQCHTILPLHNFKPVTYIYSSALPKNNEFCNFPIADSVCINWCIPDVCIERLATRRPGCSVGSYIHQVQL